MTFLWEDFTVQGGERHHSPKCVCACTERTVAVSLAVKKWCLVSKWSLWGSIYSAFSQDFCVILIQVRRKMTSYVCECACVFCVCVYTQIYIHICMYASMNTHTYIYTLTPALQLQSWILCIINNDCKQLHCSNIKKLEQEKPSYKIFCSPISIYWVFFVWIAWLSVCYVHTSIYVCYICMHMNALTCNFFLSPLCFGDPDLIWGWDPVAPLGATVIQVINIIFTTNNNSSVYF